MNDMIAAAKPMQEPKHERIFNQILSYDQQIENLENLLSEINSYSNIDDPKVPATESERFPLSMFLEVMPERLQEMNERFEKLTLAIRERLF